MKHLLAAIFLLSLLIKGKACDFSANGVGSFDGSNYTQWNYYDTQGATLGSYTQDNSIVYSGTESVLVNVNEAHNWGMRMFTKCDYPLKKDSLYNISLWVYGGNAKKIKVALQYQESGGTIVIDERDVTLSGNTWKNYQLSIISDGDYSNGRLKITFPETGTYYLDELTVTEGSPLSLEAIAPNDSKIQFSGVADLQLTDSVTKFFRFPESYATTSSNLSSPWVSWTSASKSASSAGIAIKFKTSSKNIKVKLRENTSITGGVSTLAFAVYKNGKLHEVITSTNDQPSLSLTDPAGLSNEWMISMPSYAQMEFLGLELDQGSNLETPNADNRPIYVAIGNSITNGTGQTDHSSHLTYPWQVADSLGYQLYNWGIGGSKVNEKVFENFANANISPNLITILWGYNDFNCAHVNCNTDSYITDHTMLYFKNLVDSIATNFPQAKIVCITPTYSTTAAKSSVRDLDYLRSDQTNVLNYLQGKHNNICYFQGASITDAGSLSDAVHLNDSGAAQVANKLIEVIGTCDLPTSSVSIDEAEWVVYPNPARHTLSFSKKLFFEITDVHGKSFLSGNATSVNISWLPSGMYFVKTSSQIARFIKH